MDKIFAITLCAAFLTPQIFYLFRWWKAGRGWEKLLRNFAYAFFIGLMNYLTLFVLSRFYDAHFLIQVLISFIGSMYMLKSDYYSQFIEGKIPRDSDD